VAFLDRIVPLSFRQRVLSLVLANRNLAIAAGAALAIALAAVTLLWSVQSGYAVLYAGLSGEEGGRTIAELQKLNISYRITEGGRVILVPAADVGRARLQLAARGVPKREHDEWSLFDNESLSASPFAEQVHYNRAIETSLANTIRDVDGVVWAQVMLGLPKQTSFLADAPKPSASVMLRLRPGVTLTDAQVDGIAGLVAAGVPGLSRENVTVVDQSGRKLTHGSDDALQQLPQQLELARVINRRYEDMISELLIPVLGAHNFRVSADADLDFSKTKESQVKYGDGHILSQDESTHSHPAADAAIGIPGALSNRPPETPTTAVNPPGNPPGNPAGPATQTPPPPAANNTANTPGGTPTNGAPGNAAPDAATTQKTSAPVPPDVHKTTNYDVDHTEQYLEHPAWTLRGVNVAVLVNNPTASPLPAPRIQSINTLVAAAIGSARAPHVTVVDMPFDESASSGPDGTGPWWRQPAMAGLRDNAVLALAGLLVLWGGILPLLRRVDQMRAALPAPRARPTIVAAGSPAGIPANVNVTVASDTVRAGWSGGGVQRRAVSAAAIQDGVRIDHETIRALAANDPARTAQVIKGWITHARSSAEQDG
jgi:flagellar M-ring protein FliF